MARDFTLKTGKHVKEPLTVLDVLKEVRDRHAVFEVTAFPQATLNELYLSDQQFSEVKGAHIDETTWRWAQGIPQISENLLYNLSLTYTARLMKGLPFIRAWAAEPGTDIGAAVVANAYLTYIAEQNRIDSMLERSCNLAQAHSCIAFYVTWDKSRGSSEGVPMLDEATGLPVIDAMTGEPAWEIPPGTPLGDVRVDPVTIFNYFTDGAEDIEQAKCCGVRRFVEQHEAEAILAEARVSEDVAAEQYKDVWGHVLDGVEVIEFWHKPTNRIPAGFFALIVGGHVAQFMPFPYEHGELPLSVWKLGDRSDCPHGTTHVTSAVVRQRKLNENLSVAADLTRRLARAVKLVGPSSITDQWEEGSGIISCDDPQALSSIRYIAPPDPPAWLLQQIEDDRRAIPLLFGVNEAVASGGDPRATKSARQLAYISELDGQKLSSAKKNLDAALLRMSKQILRLAQQYCAAPRLIRLLGEHETPYVQAFKGSDLNGVDVRIEPASRADMLHEGQARQAEQSAEGGYMDPMRAAELRETGLSTTVGEARGRQIVQQQIRAALAGQPVEPDPTVDPGLAVAEIDFALQVGAPPQALAPLRQAYDELAAQAANEQMGGQPPPEGGLPPEPQIDQEQMP